MTAVSGRHALRAARAVIARREGRRGIGDVAYLTYSGCLAAAIALFPVLRFIALGLAAPSVQALASEPAAVGVVTLAGALAVCAVLLIGPIRGPAVPRPFLAQFLLGSAIPRRLTLRRSFSWSSVALVALGVLAATLVTIAQGAGGVAPVLLLASAAAFGFLLAATWLLGQAAPRGITATIAAAILATGVISACTGALIQFTPWGWVALSWHDVTTSTTATPTLWPALWPVLALLVLALIAAAAIPVLLDRVSASKTLAQARRWQATGMLLSTGDAAAAVGGFRPPPHRGRRITLALRGPMAVTVLTRDLVALLRFPTRFACGVVGLVASGTLIGLCPAVPDGIRWVVALAAALVAFLSIGVWCDGLRDSGANATGASLYGWAIGPRTLAHLLAPLLAAIVLGGAATVVSASLLPANIALAGTWWVLLCAFVVAVRVYDSAKGPLPVLLLMPVVTPVGDISILNVLLWQSDAILITIAIGGGLTLAFFSGAGGIVLAPFWLVVAGAVVALLALRRYRALARPA